MNIKNIDTTKQLILFGTKALTDLMNSKCIKINSVGNDGTTNCGEVLMYGKIGEHVCKNHFVIPTIVLTSDPNQSYNPSSSKGRKQRTRTKKTAQSS